MTLVKRFWGWPISSIFSIR